VTAALRLFGILWLGLLCSVSGVSAVEADEETVFVVAHPGVPVGALARDTTRALFAMRQRNWPNGDVAQVYVLGDSHPVHVRFAKEELGVFPHQLRLAWDRAVFSGTGQAPRRVGSQAEMLEQVGATPGAIGYLTTEYLDERIQVIETE
jgi:ABC-type phosphate transport system substrate-binding protein